MCLCVKAIDCDNGSQNDLCDLESRGGSLSLIRAQQRMADCTGTIISSLNHGTVPSDRKADMTDLTPLSGEHVRSITT